MAYEKQTWANGDVITDAKLNHMEEGIKAASEIVAAICTVAEDSEKTTYTLSKTWNEINNAKLCLLYLDGVVSVISELSSDSTDTEGHLVYEAYSTDMDMTFTCLNPDDYPAHIQQKEQSVDPGDPGLEPK